MNLVEGLSREIERVGNMKRAAEGMAGMPGVNMGPYLAVCVAAIALGHRAIGTGDILCMKRAYEDLAGIN